MQVVKKIDVGAKSAKVFQIDISKKNLLIINYKDEGKSETEFFHHLTDELQRWVKRKSDPLLILWSSDDVEIRLEKINSGEKPEAVKLLERLTEWVDDDPYEKLDGDEKIRCYFCDGKFQRHEDDCLYLAIREFVIENE